MQKTEYSNTWGISQSMLKDFRFKSPKKWKEIHIDKQKDTDKKEENFTLGSLVDTILFSPEELDRRFFIATLPKLPSPAVQSIMHKIFETISTHNQRMEEMKDELPEVEYKDYTLADKDILLTCINNHEEVDKDGNKKLGWYANLKEDTRINKLIEQGGEFFELIKIAAGRRVISMEMNLEAIALKDVLYKDSTVRDYFLPSEGNELMFQLEIFVDYELSNGSKIPRKGALDILRINHNDKTLQIVDFKSSYSAFDFIKSIKQFGYCDQISYYDGLLRTWMNTYEGGKYANYTILPPINIVIDIKDKIPYIYEYDWRDIALAADGTKEFLYSLYQTHDHNQKIRKGWKELLEEVGWHYFNNKWDKPKELYEHGKIKVNLINN